MIDSKKNEYCVYLLIRECIDTYDRLMFFERDVEGADICCIGSADDMVGTVESIEEPKS